MKKEVIAVNLGGTNLRVALVKGNKVVKYIKKKTPKQKNDLIKELFDSINSIMSKNVKAIAVASAGPMKKGVITNASNLPFKRFNLKKTLKDKFHKRVEVGKDADCVALAEAKLGCKKKDFIVLTLGTGVGGGVIIDGELQTGKGYGGEFGSVHIDEERDFEDIYQDIRNRYKKEFGKETLIKDLLKMNNRKSKKFLNELSVCLGQGIASLIAIFDPEIVILSGGVKETGSKFLNMIKKEVKKYNELPTMTPVKWTKLKYPEVLGASLLVK